MTAPGKQTPAHYHQRTKHHPQRYAASLGYLDWATQPDPFRDYGDCPRLDLPFLDKDPKLAVGALFGPLNQAPATIDLANLGGLAELSLALSAWKRYGDNQWSLRINPSSGNLHPTESYWLLPQPAGLYHYNPLRHDFARRAAPDGPASEVLRQVCGPSGFLIALSSIPWRESWKYGERGFRYCNHDLGHALAALAFGARLFGWSARLLPEWGDRDLTRLLGFDRTDWPEQEPEYAEALVWIGAGEPPLALPVAQRRELLQLEIGGRANRLSGDHHTWPVIDETAMACQTDDRQRSTASADPYPPPPATPWRQSATQVIRHRRSAQSFDPGGAPMPLADFLGCMDACLPRPRYAPFDLAPGEAQVHLFVFVHRVTGLRAGIYALVRNPEHLESLRQNTDADFAWQPVTEGLPLYRLAEGDARDAARLLSCQQDIAGDGVFSLGMVGRFADVIEADASAYRRLFWEAGMIGQVLYLTAEGLGLRGTGIGCYFDDPVHELLGIHDQSYQSLYHFTVGQPLEDRRLSTLAAYHHLARRQT